MGSGWRRRLLAGAVTSALALPVLVVPQLQQLALREVAQTADWAGPFVLPAPPTVAVPPVQPPVAVRVPASRAGGSGQVRSRALPLLPLPPLTPVPVPRPRVPLRPAPSASPTEPPVRLGPVLHVVKTVARGASVPLPAGVGRPHLLCAGTTARRAEYWLDSSGGSTQVHRYDGSGTYDFYYRYVTAPYFQQKPCA